MGTLLSATLYEQLQQFVHRGHSSVFQVFEGLLRPEQEATVVELGCGTGSLAEPFLASGYKYVGVDINPERIARAKENAPLGQFFAANLMNFDFSCIPEFKYCFIHGMLHHLNDDACHKLLTAILPPGSERRLAISEPVYPDRWWENPARRLVSSLDEGDYVRKLVAWRQLLEPHLIRFGTRSLMPRWPMLKIDAVLGPSELS